MDTDIKNTIKSADQNAQYDEKAKSLLGHKYILAHILIHTVDDFKGMNPKEVVPHIEGEPLIGIVPIEPGITNTQTEKNGEKITGMNTENGEINEGLIRFDIIFYVRMKDGLSKIIVNIEAQKDEPASYAILNRAIFYVSRLLSSQKERDFVNTNYDDICRVYSIWICMNMDENSLNHIHLTNDSLLGSCQWNGKLDLLNIVLIGISNKLPEHDKQYELHRLLGAMFSKELTADEKLNIMGTEYEIPLEKEIRKDVSVMCNLSQGIWEQAETKGRAEGRTEGRTETDARYILNMHKKGYTLAQIAEISEKSIEEVKAIIERKVSIMA